MTDTYARRTGKKSKRKENTLLKNLISLVARKYKIVYGKRHRLCILYDITDVQNNIGNVRFRKTERFIARYATRFIRSIASQLPFDGQCAKRNASRKQISRMMDENSLELSVNSIIILTCILKLLQLPIDDPEFQKICYYVPSDYEYSPDCIIQNDNSVNLAKAFLVNQFACLENDPYLNSYAPGTHYLVDYINLCSDHLDNCVGSNAYRAIRIGAGRPEKQKEIFEIVPNDFPPFPA